MNDQTSSQTEKSPPLAASALEFPILPASWRDLTALSHLEKQCFSPDDAWSFLDMLAVLTLPGVVRFKAEHKGEMIAFVAGERKPEKAIGWITTLAVTPSFRRRGIATGLIAACEKELKMRVIRLSVRRSNLGALGLYKRAGYLQVGVWPKYYIGGEDALVLEKKY